MTTPRPSRTSDSTGMHILCRKIVKRLARLSRKLRRFKYDLDMAVVEEAGLSFPAGQGIADRLCKLGILADKYQDDIDDPQRGFRRNVVEPPRIPQTLTSFNLRVRLWSSLHDFVIGNGTWQPTKPHLDNVLGAANLQHWPMMQTYAKRLTPVTMFVETRGKMLLAKSFHCCSVRMF